MATIKDLNRAIAHTGIECYKGAGYFYFTTSRDDISQEYIPESVMMTRFDLIPLSDWVAHVIDHVNKTNKAME